jgi:hypothetical protein
MTDERDSGDEFETKGPKFVRRDFAKLLAATGGVLAANFALPSSWTTPHIEVGALPAHAQSSGNTEGGDLAFATTPEAEATNRTSGSNPKNEIGTNGGGSSGSSSTGDGSGSSSTGPSNDQAPGEEYEAVVDVIDDPEGHLPFTGTIPRFLFFSMLGDRLGISGNAPFVSLNGGISPNGDFSVTGQGFLAGTPNVQCSARGTLFRGGLSCAISWGDGGELGGGSPIVFHCSGERVA